MIFRAVVCPGAPLLIPGLADRLAAQVPELIIACDRAVGSLATVDRVLMLSSGPGSRDEWQRGQQVSVVHPADSLLSSALLTGRAVPPHFAGRLAVSTGTTLVDRRPAADPTAPPAGVGVIVGAALLARAGITAPVTAVELAEPADHPAEVAAVLDEARTSTDRVGLLVIAEGSASRGPLSPRGGSARAEALDTELGAALAAGDPEALAAAAHLTAPEAVELQFTAGPALLALAELTTAPPPQRAELLLAQAPLGVGYLVASWIWSQ